MDENNSDDSIKQILIRDLKVDPAAEDLMDSPAMQPYMNLALAVMGHKDPRPAIEEIAALPLEGTLYVARSIGAEMGLRGLRESERGCGPA
ncbi:MAG: hypothetical protein ABSB35_12900, partial [Bryobacteraceae bacterium]